MLNDRGLDLTAADLIKSYLLEKLYTRYKDDVDTLRMKEEQFISDWRETFGAPVPSWRAKQPFEQGRDVC